MSDNQTQKALDALNGLAPHVDDAYLGKVHILASLIKDIAPQSTPTSRFAIGDKEWAGISKLMEEAAEVVQVCAKLMGTRGSIWHWDGTDIANRLEGELGDLSAAIDFVIRHNPTLDNEVIHEQYEKKLKIFEQWHAKEDPAPLPKTVGATTGRTSSQQENVANTPRIKPPDINPAHEIMLGDKENCVLALYPDFEDLVALSRYVDYGHIYQAGANNRNYYFVQKDKIWLRYDRSPSGGKVGFCNRLTEPPAWETFPLVICYAYTRHTLHKWFMHDLSYLCYGMAATKEQKKLLAVPPYNPDPTFNPTTPVFLYTPQFAADKTNLTAEEGDVGHPFLEDTQPKTEEVPPKQRFREAWTYLADNDKKVRYFDTREYNRLEANWLMTAKGSSEPKDYILAHYHEQLGPEDVEKKRDDARARAGLPRRSNNPGFNRRPSVMTYEERSALNNFLEQALRSPRMIEILKQSLGLK